MRSRSQRRTRTSDDGDGACCWLAGDGARLGIYLKGPATLAPGSCVCKSICCNCRRGAEEGGVEPRSDGYLLDRGADTSICAAQQHWCIERNRPTNKPGALLTHLPCTVIGVEKAIGLAAAGIASLSAKAASAAVDQRHAEPVAHASRQPLAQPGALAAADAPSSLQAALQQQCTAETGPTAATPASAPEQRSQEQRAAAVPSSQYTVYPASISLRNQQRLDKHGPAPQVSACNANHSP